MLIQTGSGRTKAYCIPIVEWLLQGKKDVTGTERALQCLRDGQPPGLDEPSFATPYVLILVPVRELAIQVFAELINLTVGTKIRPKAIYGGWDIREQRESLIKGCEVLVATPGRLIHMLSAGYESGHVPVLSLQKVEIHVLDEADHLLHPDFMEQLDTITRYLSINPMYRWFFSSQYQEEQLEIAEDMFWDPDDAYYIDYDKSETNDDFRHAMVQ